MNICFMGSPQFAATILESLVKNRYNISAIYTKAPKARNRGLKISRSEVHNFGILNNIPVYYPTNFKNTNDIEDFKHHHFDLVIVAAYGLILPKSVIEAPKLGCINVHGSLLPKWRGAAPIQRAIENGDKETGITLIYMDKGMDTGDIIAKKSIPISDKVTSSELYISLAQLGSELLLDNLQILEEKGFLPREKQDSSLATYAKMLNKNEGKINFQEEAKVIERKIRAFDIFPKSYITYKNQIIQVKSASIIDIISDAVAGTIIDNRDKLYISTKNKVLSINILQRPGKLPLKVSDFLRGFPFKVGDILC